MSDRREFLKTATLAGIGLAFSGCASGTGRTASSTSTQSKPMSYTLPPLPYANNALEPHIDAQTMEIHHDKHHAAYVNNLNAALAKEPGFKAPECPLALIADLKAVPESIRTAVRNNAGGHVNHSFFWKLLSANGGGEPTGELAEAIKKSFGSFDAFKEKFAAAGTTRFGSGWAWLVVNADKSLAVVSTPNQDNPIMAGVAEVSGNPVIGLDVWEHAYYLKYQNKRPDYIAAFWKVVDWKQASENYKEALAYATGAKTDGSCKCS